MLDYFTSAAVCGAIAYFNADYIIAMDIRLVSALAGFIIMVVMKLTYKKTKKNWVNVWALTFAMFGGMEIAAIVAAVI